MTFIHGKGKAYIFDPSPEGIIEEGTCWTDLGDVMPESTHVYIGPDTPYGLKTGTKCRIIGKVAAQGGRMIEDGQLKRWIVTLKQLQKIGDK